MTSAVNTVYIEDSRSTKHEFAVNIEEQVQRKVAHASKALLKIERNDQEIKIIPNSGNFQVLAEDIVKLKVGDEI